MVNSENVLALAQFIEQAIQLEFNMRRSHVPTKECGSAGCIGGFAAALWPQASQMIGPLRSEAHFNSGEVKILLGLSHDQVGALCYPQETSSEDGYQLRFIDTDTKIEYNLITRKGAVTTLKRLAETGTVSWLQAEQTD